MKLIMCLGPIANKHNEGQMQLSLNAEFKVLEFAGWEVNWRSLEW